MSAFVMLIRREFWEHRSLIFGPVVVAALLVLATAFGSRVGGIEITVGDEQSDFFVELAANPVAQAKLFAVWTGSLLIPQMLVAMIVLFFYLLDALYAERKDRSILFWKSLPVSDASTVAAKFSVAALIMPVWVWLLSLLSGLLIFLIVKFTVAGTTLAPLGVWHGGAWLLVQATLLQNLVIAALWYAPVAAWLLAISAFAKRSPFLWAVLPPIGLMILESVAMGTSRVGDFLGYRLTSFFSVFEPTLTPVKGDETNLQAIADGYRALSAAPLLATLSLWVGVAVAGALLALAIRLRRWRDEA